MKAKFVDIDTNENDKNTYKVREDQASDEEVKQYNRN